MITAPVDLHQLAAEIKQFARSLGFDLVGIAPAGPSAHRDYFRQWLDQGSAGTMHYLYDRVEERVDPATYLPGAKSVICVAMSYYAPLQTPPADPSAGRIARYALGDDYHDLILKRLNKLADWLRATVPGTHTKRGVDTIPVMEKELAARAGIGWMGKNTCIIHHKAGSWMFLGEVLTTLELPPDQPATNHCGSCTRCIDACPTQAITGPYQLDAKKCISYLTIEHRSEIDPALQDKIGNWLYGCDICQEVCPFNHQPLPTSEPAFLPRFKDGTINAAAAEHWDIEEYRNTFRHSAIKRIKLPQLHRNAAVVNRNVREGHS